MPDAPSPDAGSLSERAQEILRRADAQLESLRTPPPSRDLPPAPPDGPGGGPGGDEPGGDDRGNTEPAHDLGDLLDTVEAGIGAARAHLVTLSASLERIAQEIDAAAEEHRRTLPPQLADHAVLPEEQHRPAIPAVPASHEHDPEEDPEAGEPDAEPPARDSAAASEAARLVAIEMAGAGETREGVGRRLREEFGIADPKAILDDAFGPAPGGRTYGA